MPTDQAIILFDGVCNLCNASVNFIIDRDKKNRFVFAALQSSIGSQLLVKYGLSPNYLGGIVLIEKGKVYLKSTAVLRVARHLSGAWFLCYAFIILPALLRNFVYDIVARRRYAWFGKQHECRMPTTALKARFLA